jgi:hypothetical protein
MGEKETEDEVPAFVEITSEEADLEHPVKEFRRDPRTVLGGDILSHDLKEVKEIILRVGGQGSRQKEQHVQRSWDRKALDCGLRTERSPRRWKGTSYSLGKGKRSGQGCRSWDFTPDALRF